MFKRWAALATVWLSTMTFCVGLALASPEDTPSTLTATDIIVCPKGFTCLPADADVECPPGWSCIPNDTYVIFTISEAVEIDTRLIDLETKLTRMKLKKPSRLGWTIGCGMGVGPVVAGGTLSAGLEASCGAYYGWRF